MSEHTIFQEFTSSVEADIVRQLLASAGIESALTSDDCGDMDPGLRFGRGVMLWVAVDDLERAKAVVAKALARRSVSGRRRRSSSGR